MRLSTGPDIRYGVELSDGGIITGSKKNVLDSAVKAWKEKGVSVVQWKVPGATNVLRTQRAAMLDKEYKEKL